MLEACFWGAWGSFGVHWRSLGVLWVSRGRSLGVLVCLATSWDRPGGPLGWFWRSGAILGSVLGGQNVAISLVLGGILRCHAFFFHRTLEVILFSRQIKHYIVFTLIFGILNVAISFVLRIFLELHASSQVRFL